MEAFENGSLVDSVDFDYEAVDRGNPLEAELTEASSINSPKDSATVGNLFGMLLTYGGVNANQMFITANVIAFSMGVHPNQGAGGVEIAAGLGMQKARWFRRVNQMRNVIKSRGGLLPKIAGEWSKQARTSIKLKTQQHHDTRRLHCSTSTTGFITSRFSRAIEKAGIGNR